MFHCNFENYFSLVHFLVNLHLKFRRFQFAHNSAQMIKIMWIEIAGIQKFLWKHQYFINWIFIANNSIFANNIIAKIDTTDKNNFKTIIWCFQKKTSYFDGLFQLQRFRFLRLKKFLFQLQRFRFLRFPISTIPISTIRIGKWTRQ